MPRELLGTYVRFAGACILRGGEYAPGRGETGYAPGRYGPSALATVTVAGTRKTAADIEFRTALRTESGAAAAARAQASAQDAEAGTLLSLLMSGDDDDDAHRRRQQSKQVRVTSKLRLELERICYPVA